MDASIQLGIPFSVCVYGANPDATGLPMRTGGPVAQNQEAKKFWGCRTGRRRILVLFIVQNSA